MKKIVCLATAVLMTLSVPASIGISNNSIFSSSVITASAAVKTPISKLSCKLSSTSYIYTGKAIKPGVTVKNGSKTLKNGTDYTVKYSSNTNVGTGKVTITGKGSYSGSKSLTFTICSVKAPTSITTSTTIDSCTIKWKKATSANGYIVERYNSSKKTWERVGKTSAATIKDKNLKNGTSYKYRVVSYRTIKNKTYKTASSSVTAKTLTKADIEKQKVFDLVNAERKKKGLTAYKTDSKLQQVADIRAKESATSFSHTRPNGQSSTSFIFEYLKLKSGSTGENLAYGQKDAKTVYDCWYKSAGHNANMFSKKFKYMAVGYYEANGKIYWSQAFYG